MAQITPNSASDSPAQQQGPAVGSVLVVGAGIAGIRAALDLAEVGYRVLLTESSPAIGGILSKLDHQFPTDHCGMCKMLPMVGREYASQYCMRKSLFHDNIKLMPFTEITAIQGQPGAFQVEMLRRARHVDTDVCIGTGRCEDVCPIAVPSEFNQGMTERKAIYRPVPHNIPNMYLIDMDACTRCGECVKVCPVGAIQLDTTDERLSTEVDAIVLAAGSPLHDPLGPDDQTSYGTCKDVVTAVEFERLISSTGTYDGSIRRPSDARPAKRIAWLQCVGSRNRKEGRDYCSSVCCMFALKQAVLAHDKAGPDVDTTIFYMDMRTFGKDFWRYRERAENERGVKLVRCRVRVVDRLDDGSLRIRYLDPQSSEWRFENFDLIVLSIGQKPSGQPQWLTELLGSQQQAFGAGAARGMERIQTPREGVFVCGSLTGLTDISEALTGGSAAASAVTKLMVSIGRRFKQDAGLPAERPVEREHPSIHVLLCRWNNGGLPEGIDLEALRRELLACPGVGAVDIVATLCRGEGLASAGDLLNASTCNRVLFGACLPYAYRQRLKVLASKAGINPSLVDVTDLRGTIQHHLQDTDMSTAMLKLRRQLMVAVQRLRMAEPVESHRLPVCQEALVVGGGVTGMKAALSLANRGIRVHLVEKADRLGGLAGDLIEHTIDGVALGKLVDELRLEVLESSRITVYKGTEVTESTGSLGSFRTVVRSEDGESCVISHGAVILATGAQPASTTAYGYGTSDRIVTQAELGKALSSGKLDASALGTVVMIQCVGSRELHSNAYCSRVCCAGALKNALLIRKRSPGSRIVVLYRDMTTYGELEQYYTRARGEGIVFATYEPAAKPSVLVDSGKLKVGFVDPVLREPIELTADLVCLATGIAPNPANAGLARIFKVELTADGFFKEADSKWRPVDALKEGVFFAGTAHSPRLVEEALVQAEAAAHRAFTFLCRRELTTARVTSRVHDLLCARCHTCIAACPYQARTYDQANESIAVDAAACQGCGVCAASCPSGAADVVGIRGKQQLAVVEAELSGASLDGRCV